LHHIYFYLRNEKFSAKSLKCLLAFIYQNFMNIKLYTIPNFLTLGNLLCGSVSVFLLSGCLALLLMSGIELNHILINTLLILLFLSLILDLLDGMVARALKINSEIGVQLDSLADVVSFGLVPGLMMAFLISSSRYEQPYLAIFGLIITLFSALRLAKFNVDTEQTTYFKGLATPANTVFMAGLLWIQTQNGYIISSEGNIDFIFLLAITGLFSWLLVADIPMFSFKFKGFGWKDNYHIYSFLFISLILLVIFWIKAFAFIIPLYIIISIIYRKKIIHA